MKHDGLVIRQLTGVMLRTCGVCMGITQNTWLQDVSYSEHMVMVLVAHGRSIVYIISTSYIATDEQYK